jgi:hypothetical protein
VRNTQKAKANPVKQNSHGMLVTQRPGSKEEAEEASTATRTRIGKWPRSLDGEGHNKKGLEQIFEGNSRELAFVHELIWLYFVYYNVFSIDLCRMFSWYFSAAYLGSIKSLNWLNEWGFRVPEDTHAGPKALYSALVALGGLKF